MRGMGGSIIRGRMVQLTLAVALLGAIGAATSGSAAGAGPSRVTTSSLGQHSPTFVGPVATGCASGCSLLSGPITTPSTASSASSTQTTAASPRPAAGLSGPQAMRSPTARSGARQSLGAAASPTPVIPNVRCEPLGAGCDSISTSAGGATGVKGLNAVDSGSLITTPSGTSSLRTRACAPATETSSRPTTQAKSWSTTRHSSASPLRSRSTL